MLVEDGDGDGLADLVETPDHIGTNPFNPDTDGDGLSDGDEIVKKTDPLEPDTDRDGVMDSEDIDPFHDLLVTVKIRRIKILDPVDYGVDWESISIPYPVVKECWDKSHFPWYVPHYHTTTEYYDVEVPVYQPVKYAEPAFAVKISDQWRSKPTQWVHSDPTPLAIGVEDYYFTADFPMNVPDDEPTVDIQIAAWDWDLSTDLPEVAEEVLAALLGLDSLEPDMLDISRSPRKILHIMYYLDDYYGHRQGTWSGDTSNEVSIGVAGKRALIEFSVKTEYELSYEEQRELAEEYSPILYFRFDEKHSPRDIRDFLDHAVLKDGSGNKIISTLKPENLTNYSGENYKDYYLDLDDTYHEIDSSTYDGKIYAHVFTAYNHKIVIQYWFFYLYNDGLWPAPDHEGDWEMIQLVLPSKTSSPSLVSYSWHYSVKISDWSLLLPLREGNHPKVYVAVGGHASRFKPLTEEEWALYVVGRRWEINKDYTIDILSHQTWLSFWGHWGELKEKKAESGPPGPVFRYSANITGEDPFAYMWTDPIFWGKNPTYPAP
ncbi:MAG: hypothetical protein ACE5I5_19760, partial [Candidatus Heimdallarchaeota archaeon]